MGKTITEKELDLIFPETEVEIAGCTITLKPFSFHETFVVANKLKNVIRLLRTGMSVDQIALAIIESGDGIEEVVAMALDIELQAVKDMDNKNAMKAIIKIIEVNRDFFSESVQGELEGLNAMMQDDLPDSDQLEKK